jgi:outer membrane protein OmpA-like peptidoglycan-associated protein
MKKLLSILLLSAFIGNAQMTKTSTYFKAGGISSSETSGFEFFDWQVGGTYMFNQTLGLNLLGDYAHSDTWKFQHVSLEGVLSSDALTEDTNFTFLARAGVAYLFTKKYANMPIFEEERSFKLSLGADLIYWISPRIGINAYVDYIPFISQNDKFECDCVEYEINNKADLLTVGLGLRFNLGKPMSNRYFTAIDKVDKKADKLRKEFEEHKNEPVHTEYIFTEKKEDKVWFVMFPYNVDVPSEWAEAKEAVYYLLMNSNKKVEITGYASTEGSIKHNLDLANRRAEQVKLILTDYKINEDRITVNVVGEESQSIHDFDKFKNLDRTVIVKVL